MLGHLPRGEDTETTDSVIYLEVRIQNYLLGYLLGGEDTETTYSVIFLEVRIQKLPTWLSSWR
jgi:hypothetical protein